MILLVYKDAFLGVKMRRLALDTFVLGAALVSLGLLVTFLSSLLPDS